MLYVDFDELRWVNGYLSYIKPLTDEDFEHLKTFAFMWDMFQAKACKGVASPQNIADFVLTKLKLERQNRSSSVIDAYYSYFVNRYVKDKELNSLFYRMIRDKAEAFNTERGEYTVKEFIGDTLLNSDSTEINKTLACLLIAYRWRSNFFQEDRDPINVSLQYKNFNMANKLIAMVLQQYKKNNE